MNRKWKSFIATLAFAMIMSGCGGGSSGGSAVRTGEESPKPGEPADEFDRSKPVTLKIVDTGLVTDEEFQRFVVEPVNKKYPNITLELVRQKYSVDRYELLLAKGEKFDLLFEANLLFDDVITAKLADNMEPMLKKHKIDTSKIEQVALDSFKIASGGQYLSGVPFTRHFNVLYYNKDLFDKFGVAYPKDGMTWQETIELARKLTRTIDDNAYRGFDPDHVFRVASTLGLPIIDAKTQKSAVAGEKWKEIYEMYKTLYEIPGYKENFVSPGNYGEFTKGKVAMFAGINLLPYISKVSDQLNWDMAAFPSFKEAPGIGHEFDGHGIVVTSISENKDAAYKVVEVLLSEETQLDMSQNAKMPVLKDAKVREEFGKNVAYLKGKNIQAIYKSTPAKSHVSTLFDSKARTAMNKYNTEVLKGTKDINTALRQMDEEINKIIAEGKK
ncbi:ABC transporter substrate-binding protein [Paenibacillus oceani]|uniref:Extracellular solute-binding protein n=1 Tax=Paenibacillus oceani TaxID=2772510 RepID=A0A927C6E6_9BACL|nr:extracellular solute-binding protein [Paenibacillus oceani]MBD2862214.1 extracellular solute-binding protein [Paenibacillus oceani]